MDLSWLPREKDLKKYPHFDGYMTPVEAQQLACDPLAVSRHAFFPFILVKKSRTRFAKKGEMGRKKVRPIRYAARGDAYIFARYRHLLLEKYEERLQANGLSDSVIAYRKIAKDSGGGKCNIDFAAEAFGIVKAHSASSVICLDISAFFESLDHSYLKSAWEDILGVDRLPEDHFRVFEAITNYAVVDKQDVYERLGHYGPKNTTKAGHVVNGYTTPFRSVPTLLCSGKVFREKIAGGDGRASLIKKNLRNYGIPQGSPISDLLANLYLLQFDIEINKIVQSLGGRYFRYSDDILVVSPISIEDAVALESRIRSTMGKFGKKMKIKEEKSSVGYYSKRPNGNYAYSLAIGEQGKNGLEYLGFRFDGRNVRIRDSTISNLFRKTSRTARASARRFVGENPTLTPPDLLKKFNFEAFIKRFHNVEKFENLGSDIKRWTFWTYVKRAVEGFPESENAIRHQFKGYRAHATRVMRDELYRAYAKSLAS